MDLLGFISCRAALRSNLPLVLDTDTACKGCLMADAKSVFIITIMMQECINYK